MTRFNAITDLTWRMSGDFVLGASGDLEDTRYANKYTAFIQKVQTRIESATYDWPLLGIGANLGNILGMPNSKETADFILRQVNAELQRDGLLKAKEYQIDIFPVNRNMMQMIIAIFPPGSNQKLVLNYQYLLRDNRYIPRFLEVPT